jgi:hypothetical protein
MHAMVNLSNIPTGREHQVAERAYAFADAMIAKRNKDISNAEEKARTEETNRLTEDTQESSPPPTGNESTKEAAL